MPDYLIECSFLFTFVVKQSLNVLVRSENLKYTGFDEEYDGIIFRVAFSDGNSDIYQVKRNEYIHLEISDAQFDALAQIWREKEPKYGVIDIKQNVLVHPEYDWISESDIQNGLKVRKDNLYGVVDLDDNELVEIRYTAIRNLSDGLRAVLVGDKWGYIDIHGNMVIKPTFTDCFEFHNGRAWATKSSKYGVIDKTGNFVVEPTYTPCKYDSYVGAGIFKFVENRKLGAVDNNGKILCEPKYESIRLKSDSLELIMPNGDIFVSDLNGNIIGGPYEERTILATDRVAVKINGLWGVVDSSNHFVIKPEYDEIKALRGAEKYGYLLVSKDGNICIMDFDGNVIVKPQQCSDLGYANEKYLVLWKGVRNPKASLIDYEGKVVTKETYNGIEVAGDNRIKVRIGNQYGVCDFAGNFIIEPKYYGGHLWHGIMGAQVEDTYDSECVVFDAINGELLPFNDMFYTKQDEEYAVVGVAKEDKKLYGLIDKDGKVVIEPIYNSVSFRNDELILVKSLPNIGK